MWVCHQRSSREQVCTQYCLKHSLQLQNNLKASSCLTENTVRIHYKNKTLSLNANICGTYSYHSEIFIGFSTHIDIIIIIIIVG
jgi:hypothetical protein